MHETIFCDQMHKYNKLDEISLKNLVSENISPSDLNHKILLIYYLKFRSTYLVNYI